jgi:hypothetical protein
MNGLISYPGPCHDLGITIWIETPTCFNWVFWFWIEPQFLQSLTDIPLTRKNGLLICVFESSEESLTSYDSLLLAVLSQDSAAWREEFRRALVDPWNFKSWPMWVGIVSKNIIIYITSYEWFYCLSLNYILSHFRVVSVGWESLVPSLDVPSVSNQYFQIYPTGYPVSPVL